MASPNESMECIQWWKYINPQGYGTCNKNARWSSILAHRFIYQECFGPIPDGMTIDHTCHTEAVKRGECAGGSECSHRACVNPAHMEVVTREENIRRGNNFQGNKTHCKWGHPFSGDNLIVYSKGRLCRKCQTKSNRHKAPEKVST